MTISESALKSRFSARLQEAMRSMGINQAELARRSEISQTQINGWVNKKELPTLLNLLRLCELFGCTRDWLLGFVSTNFNEYIHDNLRWIEQYPDYIEDSQKSEIDLGIRFFHSLVIENLDIRQAVRSLTTNGAKLGVAQAGVYRNLDLPTLYAAFKTAVWSGCLQLTHVDRDEDLEQRLKTQFDLNDVVVASIPQNYDADIMRAEFVAFLAATRVLQNLQSPGAVGVGGGYTLLRMAELSVPSLRQFRGTKWVPMIAYAQQHIDERGRSANFVARVLANCHAGSEATYLPYVSKDQQANDMELVGKAVSELATEGAVAFITVNGLGRKSRASDRPDPVAQFRTADYIASYTLRPIYELLVEEGLEGKIAGEILELPLDSEAQVVGSEKVRAKLDEFAYRIGLDNLRSLVDRGTVWIVAARAYKARPTLVALKNRLANALVVDSEIAEYLLALGEDRRI